MRSIAVPLELTVRLVSEGEGAKNTDPLDGLLVLSASWFAMRIIHSDVFNVDSLFI
jgi:hypothetical protein